MSKHKRIDWICGVGAVIMVLLTVLFLGGGGVLLEAVAADMPYVQKLFDTGKVHTVDIVAGESDWQEMLQNAAEEEYISCALVIDGESYKNVAIRPKGNSSLSTVAGSDSDRYSFKIEFDHYDKNTTYYGLDKLCLNNVIQDNTYLKDYLCYQMMNALGADAPLASFVWITVNGEDWGLYLAAEGVEEAFAEREYGSDHGQIYKPDSMSMGGGGRGAEAKNGEAGENAMPGGFGGMENPDPDSLLSGLKDDDGNYPQAVQKILDELEAGTLSLPGDLSTILSRLEEAGVTLPDELQQMAEPAGQLQNGGFGGMGRGGFEGGASEGGEQARGETAEAPVGNSDGENGVQEGAEPPALPQEETGEAALPGEPSGEGEANGGRAGGGFGGGGMGGSDDVLLVYTDDDPDSYSNIFENAVFDGVSDADEARLIESLKKLNEGDIENSVNMDEVLRYFAVHNFVLNGDSYTGSIIHNYYLYEDEGILSMIAWDYNLAFGGMGMGGMGSEGATPTVNSPIDSPVTSGDTSERPMVAWIFEDEDYTRQYHEVMDEFISEYFESGYFETMIDETVAMISPYVEKDPTAFCTYEEFQKGAETLKEFCLLRAESVRGQLDGTIPSTSEGQSGDDSGLIDASHITISDMGAQGGGMGGENGRGFFAAEPSGESSGTQDASAPAEDSAEKSQGADNAENSQAGDTAGEEQTAGKEAGEAAQESAGVRENRMQMPGNFSGTSQTQDNAGGMETWLLLGGSGILLLGGLLFAKFFH